MTSRILLLAGTLCLLSGCDGVFEAPQNKAAPTPETANPVKQETTDVDTTPVETVERVAIETQSAKIDWTTARQDLASAEKDDANDTFSIETGAAAPPVPVLLPTGIVIPASAQNDAKFQPLQDGYFAVYPGIDYDIVVNGTNEVAGSSDADADDEMRFQTTATGAMVSLSRYGADYLVQFECKDDIRGNCISEDDAMSITNSLVIAGTR